MLSDKQWEELEKVGELDFAYSSAGFSRVRINAFRQRGTYAMAMRILSFEIPSPQQLGIPKAVVDLTNRKRGLVLVTGATGSGKSTTLASLISIISEKYAKNIITLEDPIEYLHKHKKSVVIQREVGADTLSYANAVRAALRQDPDVILVGEMRDLETISTAITAAETGHLVFSTLHTNSAADAIDRVIDVFPPHQQQQIRVQLAAVIEGVVAQQLVPRLDGGRVAAIEVMIANPAIRNLIREGKAFQIPTILQTSKKEGMQTMDDCLYELMLANFISRDSAINFAHDQNAMIDKTSNMMM
jgi:twitching motility protein PilT